ncbi:MAG: hypothetical protein CVU12_07930 [Bacteroidetes bacterium HGW-Bacteroidetes-7]|jgi:hypothetical protein|nr:MAG: hypothetical protein CVU12_07930 [Bacteroidetes bacterium HGW-Bacteroidetes-7]
MKDIFNINRFGKLLKKELSERLPIMLKIAVILSISLVGFWLTYIIFKTDPQVSSYGRAVYLFLVTYFTAVMAPFNMYKGFNHHKKGIDYISLPASVQEKFLSMVIISLVAMPLLVFAMVMMTDTAIALINPSVFKGFIFSDTSFLNSSSTSFADLSILPLFCLLGNLLFRGNKVVKTFLSIAGTYIVFILIVAFLFLYVFKDQITEIQGLQLQIKLTVNSLTELYRNEVFEGYPAIKVTIAALAVLYNVGFPVGALTGAYYRMKTIQY